MLGWEFPPFFAGGVGIVCYELTKALCEFQDIEISYVMPYGPQEKFINDNFKIKSANSKSIKENINFSIKNIPSTIYAYDGEDSYNNRIKTLIKTRSLIGVDKSIKEIYGSNLIEEVFLYANRIVNLCVNDDFDVIHAHDWTTFPAAIMLGEITGKPVIIHTHITELDKTGGSNGNSIVMEIEKEGFLKADKIIAVSNLTKNRIVNDYGIDPSKIIVVHNGGISDSNSSRKEIKIEDKKDKVVLFAGRITMQKGPEYFIRAAAKVLEYEPNTKFVVAGSGDMLDKIIELTHELKIAKSFKFLGRFSREEAELLFSNSDIFVMPSISEPFGIVPLEAIAKGTPVIISKQSGISEVLENSFKVNFWDIEDIANKILSLLRYKELHNHLSSKSYEEFNNFSWDIPAKKIIEIYKNLI